MKNIGIFCDGTWQHIDQAHPTNVALLARASLPQVVVEGVPTPQVVYYDDGVGVSQGVLDEATQLLGGAFGKGLDYKIARAYEFLALNYDPGDRIFIFGFSRGAYTARSLAGLLRWLGILKRENASHALEAMVIYRTRDPKPQDAAAQQAEHDAFEAQTRPFRERYAHHSEPFTRESPYRPGQPSSLTPAGDCSWVQYVGVFDTVGSLGVPNNIPFADVIDKKYRFYDTNLSAFVRSARHAVSIDERRKTFAPTLWDNIAPLNANADADGLTYEFRPYQQRWFPGGHGAVGGGGADGGLSLPALLWIAEGACRAGYGFDPAAIDRYLREARPDAPFARQGLDLGEFVLELDGVADRAGPDLFDEVSLAARLRHALTHGGYDPPPLRRAVDVRVGLEGFEAPAGPPAFFRPDAVPGPA